MVATILGNTDILRVALLVNVFLVYYSSGLIHDLKIKNDNRKHFFIENFGFDTHGELHMEILNFKVGGKSITADQTGKVGFIIKKTDTDQTTFEPEPKVGHEKCIELLKDTNDIVVTIHADKNSTVYTHIVPAGEEGFYNTYFVSCLPQPVSFELKLTQYNVDANGVRNYLSYGYSPLPTIYGLFTLAYVVCLVIWIFSFVRATGTKVNRIHHLMTVLMVLKLLSLFFKTIEYHFIKTTGSAAGWSVPYYIFAVLKGIMLFVLIALIGTGWSFVKPFLADKEKKIFLVVIPLQILDNIAMIIIEETAPGSLDIFRLVDIICCGAILIPIIWSIKHLREASQIDGKAARNMQKLKLFRQFYLMVVSYIYFTRIIVYLVDATLPFRLVWLGAFFAEGATLLFFCVTGIKFKPLPDNPYFTLEDEGPVVELENRPEDN